MPEDPDDLAARARAAFASDLERDPPMSLAGGNDVDGYDLPTPFDPVTDHVTDEYIELYAYHALPHLDPDSWRHYLAPLIDYALRHLADRGNLVVQGLIWGFLPPDRDPPRFGSLDASQEAIVVAFLERAAFDEAGEYAEDAMQAIDEWWGPKAKA